MKKFRILVVDDDDNMAFLIQQRLQNRGCEVRRANDSETGFSIFLNFRPDIVITDVMIGEEDGLRLMNHIRNFAPNIKTIYITGALNRHRAALEEERKRHGVSVLEKPFVGFDLVRLVYALEHGREERAT